MLLDSELSELARLSCTRVRKVTLFFGSRDITAGHRDRMRTLTCLPDALKDMGAAVMPKTDAIGLSLIEDLFVMLIAEGATVLACPLNLSLFGMTPKDRAEGIPVCSCASWRKR